MNGRLAEIEQNKAYAERYGAITEASGTISK
jgi:hypothetical protein